MEGVRLMAEGEDEGSAYGSRLKAHGKNGERAMPFSYQ
jgi:hypothetical protein